MKPPSTDLGPEELGLVEGEFEGEEDAEEDDEKGQTMTRMVGSGGGNPGLDKRVRS